MSPLQLVAVGVRLFTAWLALVTLRDGASLAFLPSDQKPPLSVAIPVLVICALVVVALWTFPLSVARKLLPRESAEVQPHATPDLWLAMGCALIGLWLLTSALPSLVFNLYVQAYSSPGAADESIGRLVIYYAAEVVIGLWLVFGANGFRQLFWWARNAGTRKAL